MTVIHWANYGSMSCKTKHSSKTAGVRHSSRGLFPDLHRVKQHKQRVRTRVINPRATKLFCDITTHPLVARGPSGYQGVGGNVTKKVKVRVEKAFL